jgi:hypothetical protein
LQPERGADVSGRPDGTQLVGTSEIAERLGMKSYNLVNNWIRRHPDFPGPLAEVSGVRVWYWPEVLEWAERTGRAAAEPQNS